MRAGATVVGFVMAFGVLTSSAGAQQRPEKKFIQYGWGVPWPDFLRSNIKRMEARPFDGVIFRLKDYGLVFDTRSWDTPEMAGQIETLRAVEWKKFTDNFLCLYAANKRGMNWFNDEHWKTISANLTLAVRAAKAARCVGMCFDPEPYGVNPWKYPGAYEGKTFAEMYTQVRRRGAQFMKALQGEMPQMHLLTFLMLSRWVEGRGGHILKLLSFFMIYRAVISSSLQRPYAVLFTNLADSENALRSSNELLLLASRQLQVANRDLEAFSHTAAHDLRSPVALAHSFAQIILERAQDDRRVTRAAEQLVALTGRMDRLLSSMLRFSRTRQEDLKRKDVDLAAIARQAAKDLQRLDPARQTRFHIADQLMVRGDPDLLSMVVQNLFQNAWKATRDSERALISLEALPGSDPPRIRVTDNGHGFDPSAAERIFEPFQRLGAAPNDEGSGIGLATARRIVERHGGEITATGRPGEGAVFEFSLPEVA